MQTMTSPVPNGPYAPSHPMSYAPTGYPLQHYPAMPRPIPTIQQPYPAQVYYGAQPPHAPYPARATPPTTIPSQQPFQ